MLACILLVLWVRTIPLSLLAADDWASKIVRNQLRHRITQEVSHELPQPAWRAQVNRRTHRWIAQHQEQFETEKAAVAQRLKAQLRYEGADGREHVYLGDFDSYLWLRHARNYLRTGTTCDAMVNGVCRDTYANAPVGSRMIYHRSLHIVAIASLHKLLTLVHPGYPLPASAFLVPVIIGALGVIPAFCIGRQLAGTLGGLFAAVLISLQPIFLWRSIGSDNDVWNVVLPLGMMWAVMAALGAKNPRCQITYSVLTAVVTALHAWTWRGWLFTYLVLIFGLLGYGFLCSIRHALWQRNLRLWQAAEVRKTVLVTMVFYGAAGLGTTLAGSEQSYFSLLCKGVRAVVGAVAESSKANAADAAYWPDVLTTVGELLKPSVGAIAWSLGGTLFFFGGLVGLLMLLLPKGRWRWWHVAMLLCGMILDGYVLTRSELVRSVAVGLLAIPLIGALLLHVVDMEAPGAAEQGAACLVMVWFLAALHLASDGLRFLLLLGPPFGIACAVAVSRLYVWVRSLTLGASGWYRAVATTLLFAVLALALMQPVRWGYATARNYTPPMNDAWWDTLTNIRDASPSDALVNTWWDYGHWVKYVAERRVSSDGGSLLTHVPHWLGKALVSPSDRESIGVLRMLDCGSDATPLPEGQQGAYGKIRATGRDPITAYAIVEALVTLDKTAAHAYLAHHGFTVSQQADILRSTHCVPPETYLILSSALLQKRQSWMHLGLWAPRQAHIAKHTQFLPPEEAVADLMERFGYTEQQAAELYAKVRAQAPKGRLEGFIAPARGRLLPRWLPCHAVRNTSGMVCDIQVRMHAAGPLLEAFVYNPTSPQDARLRVRRAAGESIAEGVTEEIPAVVVLADVLQKEDVTFPSPTYSDLGVLVDIPNQRILVGSPPLLQSTFISLMYLDGRYTTYYEKFDERSTLVGERVVTWKLNWGGH